MKIIFVFQPTLTKKLVIECPGLKNPLIGALSLQKPRALPRSASGIATFAMLSSNITKAVIALDEIRRDTKYYKLNEACCGCE